MSASQLLYYPSRLDNVLQPLPVCSTDDGGELKPLILDVSPGAISDLQASMRKCASHVEILERAGCMAVVARPCGRGPGTVYQGPGEVDFFEAVEFLCRQYPIDRNRISIMGGSMGGAATWYLASHYPDFFSAAAPFCGYCDYRQWPKPGGTVMPTQEWEHPLWQSRGAAFRVGNLTNTPIWIVHGEWDTAIGGGVPVEHSRRMSSALSELGIEHRYTEVPECGHGCMLPHILEEVLPWMCQQVRVVEPAVVNLTVHTLRHQRSHYLQIDGCLEYGIAAHARAELEGDKLLISETVNVSAITIGPLTVDSSIEIEGTSIGMLSAGETRTMSRSDDSWSELEGEICGKRRGCSGPVGDIFFDPVLIIQGTAGTAEENFILEWLAPFLVGHFKKKNGGVHRGVFDGESHYEMGLVKDDAVTDQQLAENNLVLLGTPSSNRVMASIQDDMPIRFENGSVSFHGREFKGEGVGACVASPSPFAPDRLIVALGGNAPKAIAGATVFGFQLLPDYIVWDESGLRDWGFFNQNWQ